LTLRDDLRAKGIPESEIDRIEANPSEITAVDDWPPKITGVDKQAEIILNVPDTGYPPDKPYEPYLAEPTIQGPVHTKAKPDQQGAADATATPEGESQSSMHGEEGHQGSLLIPQDWGVNTQNEQLQFPFLWDISDDGTIGEARPGTEVTHDKDGKFVKKGTTNTDIMTDLTLPDKLEKLDLEYHQPEGIPHVITKPAPKDDPDHPYVAIGEEPLEQEASSTIKLPEQLEKLDLEYHQPEGAPHQVVKPADPNDPDRRYQVIEPLEQEASSDLELPDELQKLDLEYHQPEGPPHQVTGPPIEDDESLEKEVSTTVDIPQQLEKTTLDYHQPEGPPHQVVGPPKVIEDDETISKEVTTSTSLPQQLQDYSKEYHDPDEPYPVLDVRIVSDKSEHSVPVNVIEDDESLEQEAVDEEKKRKDWLKKMAPWLALIGSGLVLEEILMQEKLEIQARYVYTGHESPEICEGFNRKVYNLLDKTNRPVPPSEGLGFTNTHPNCKCYWEMVTLPTKTNKATRPQKKHIHQVNKIIGQRAKAGTLHTVKSDGTLSSRTRSSNPRNEAYTVDYNRIIETHMIREAVMDLRQEFKWMTKKYESAIKQLPVSGQWYVIRASTSTITDHRSEGEPYRRLLSNDELHALTRTAIGKEMDINHNPEWKTQAHIYDAEFDKMRGESQMLILEQDPEVIQAIRSGAITAVSINGGSPRSERVECTDDECFLVPEGVVLGELDNVALTWVVTADNGMYYKGVHIPAAMPGVKNTIIEEF